LGEASRFQNHFLEISEDGQISSPLDEKTLSEKERVPLQLGAFGKEKKEGVAGDISTFVGGQSL